MLKILGVASSAIVLLHSGSVRAQNPLRGYTCAQVREAVVKYGGPANAESLARSHGGTDDREIAAAKRCWNRPKHFRGS